MEIKNLKRAAQRIKEAVKSKENIILYGDADLDGAASVIILEETIKNIGGRISALYFPNRETEGYGITEAGLDFLKRFSPALFIVVDLGISNFKEIESANEMGFEVIVVDHHETLGKLPPASIIVDPKQEGDKYPFKGLSATGVSFKLSRLILGKKMTKALRESFLELVALATIADMMPRTEENQAFIEEGLNSLERTFRPGIRALLSAGHFGSISGKEASQGIITALGAADNINHINEIYILLTETDEKEAEAMARELLERSRERQMRIQEITEEVGERISRKPGEPIIFEGDASWRLNLLGAVASRICNRQKKPTFLFSIGRKESPGAVRVPKGLDSVKLMAGCSKLLKTYGGHPLASGFRIENGNLEKFRQCLIKHYKPL